MRIAPRPRNGMELEKLLAEPKKPIIGPLPTISESDGKYLLTPIIVQGTPYSIEVNIENIPYQNTMCHMSYYETNKGFTTAPADEFYAILRAVWHGQTDERLSDNQRGLYRTAHIVLQTILRTQSWFCYRTKIFWEPQGPDRIEHIRTPSETEALVADIKGESGEVNELGPEAAIFLKHVFGCEDPEEFNQIWTDYFKQSPRIDRDVDFPIDKFSRQREPINSTMGSGCRWIRAFGFSSSGDVSGLFVKTTKLHRGQA